MKKFFLASAVLTSLAILALLAFHATRSHPESNVQLPIAQYLPTGEKHGWTYEDLPLGHTESLDARAHEILGLTDFVYRRYTYAGGGGVSDAGVSEFPRPVFRSFGGRKSGCRMPEEQSSENLKLRLPASDPRPPTSGPRPPTSDFRPPANLRPGDSFEIYIAYWAPGTMPARLMNSHTPDTCWVGAGWQITARDDGFLWGRGDRVHATVGSNYFENAVASGEPPSTALAETPASGLRRSRPPITAAQAALAHLPIPDLAALPGRWRIFEKGGHEIPVVFWHILEDELYQYGHQSVGKRLKRLIMDPFENGLDTRKEQWLVRVSF